VVSVFSFTFKYLPVNSSAVQVLEREREEEEEADEVLPTLPAVQMPKKSSLTGGICKCFRGKCRVRRVLFSVLFCLWTFPADTIASLWTRMIILWFTEIPTNCDRRGR
jgi:hypothetical protein